MIKLIIFDWDDVIVTGAKEGYYDCYHKAIESVGVRLPLRIERDRILEKWSKTNDEEIKYLLKENPNLFPNAIKKFNEEYWGETFLKHQKLIRGVKKTLIQLKKRYLVAVATSGNKKMIEEKVIPFFSIPNVFSLILSSEEMPSSEKMKPHPMILKKIMKRLKVKPSETLYVGDANTDIQMALSAKVIPVAVLTGHLTRLKAQKERAQYIIEDITNINKVLKDLGE